MPKAAPIMKIQKCRSFGANVLVKGDKIVLDKFLTFENFMKN
jgi:threonine dehydratase